MSDFLAFHCPHCAKPLRAPLERIPPGGTTAICKGCQHRFLVTREGVSAGAERTSAEAVAPSYPAAEVQGPPPEEAIFAVKTPAGVIEDLTEQQVLQRIQTKRILPWDRMSERGGPFSAIMKHADLGPQFESLEPTIERSCWRHRRSASLVCTQCGRGYCEQCQPPSEPPGKSVPICPACEGVLEAGDPRWHERPFWERRDEVLRYPVEDRCWMSTASIGLLLWIGSLGGLARIFDVIALVYTVHIVSRSAKGQKKLGVGPDLSNPQDLAASGGMGLLATAIVFLPLILFNVLFVYGSLNEGRGAGPLAVLNVPLGLATFGYYPMALGMSVVGREKWLALQPSVVLNQIRSIREDYTILLAAWFFLIAMAWVIGAVLGWIPFLGGLLGSLVWAYASVIEAHVLGWTLYMNAPVLGLK